MGHRFSASVQGEAGTTVLPSASLYAGANKDLRLFEVHGFGTVATASRYLIRRLDTAGTKPAAVTDAPYDTRGPAATGEVSGTHTVGPTLDEIFERLVFGASIGAGIILTFGKEGLLIPNGIVNGIGVVLNTGIGQAIDWTWVWEE